MTKLRRWFKTRPPGRYITTLEGCVKFLNYLLAIAGLTMIGYAVRSWIMVCGDGDSGAEFIVDRVATSSRAAPWFIYACATAGGMTCITAITALFGVYLKSIFCMNANILLMGIVITGQLCLAVALAVDHSWERSLPPDASGDYERLKKFILARQEVFKWMGIAVMGTQVVTLLLSCALQAAYVSAEEAAEDYDEEQADLRQSLLRNSPR